MCRLYSSLCYWLDEPRLHDASLYLPALPQSYEAARLKTIIHDDHTPWLELVNWYPLRAELTQLTADWQRVVAAGSDHAAAAFTQLESCGKTAQQRILERLASSDDKLPAPALPEVRPAVPEISDTVLYDKQGLLFSLRADFAALCDCAKLYHNQVSMLWDMDCLRDKTTLKNANQGSAFEGGARVGAS